MKHEDCGVKMVVNDAHRLCLLCLGEGHNTAVCPACHQVTPKALDGRVARLKVALRKKAVGAQDPHKEYWPQFDKGVRAHSVTLAPAPLTLEAQTQATTVKLASEPPLKKAKEKAECSHHSLAQLPSC